MFILFKFHTAATNNLIFLYQKSQELKFENVRKYFCMFTLGKKVNQV